VPRRHYPRSAVKHRSEVVPVAQFSFAGGQSHPHRQLQRPLRGNGRVDRRLRRAERGDYSIASVAEQEPVMRLDRIAQNLVVRKEGSPHRFRVGFPPTGRTLNIGEQKSHNPRRRSPRGHLRRMPQKTQRYLEHRRNTDTAPTGPLTGARAKRTKPFE